MKTISLLNEKGGVGKTTTAITIATLLAQMGHSTCVIDTDTQGHVAERLKLRAEDGFYSLMQGEEWQNVLRPVAPDYYGGKHEQPLLWVVPGSDGTRLLDSDLSAKALIDRLDEIRQAFEFVIFDTSPKLGDIHAALYAVSDYIIIPTECTRLSVKGVISTISHIQQAIPAAERAGFSVASVLGIVPTKFNGTKKVHYQNLGWIDGRYGDKIRTFTPIRFLTDWEKAEAKQMPIHMYNPRSAAATDARGLVKEILGRVEVAHA
jgi:chromosome partitioning protein